jgi:hypothetical protein
MRIDKEVARWLSQDRFLQVQRWRIITYHVNFLENFAPLNVLWLSAYEKHALIRTVKDHIPSGLNSSAQQQNQMARDQGPLWGLAPEPRVDNWFDT